VHEAPEEQLAIARLVAEIAAWFIAADAAEIDGAISRAVRLIGERLGVDGAHVGAFTDDRTRLRLTHQWVDQRLPPTLDHFQAFPVATLPWSAARVLAGEAVVLHGIEELPPEAEPERLLYGALGIEAMVLLPLKMGGAVEGIVAFACARGRRRWSDGVLASLRATAVTIAAALAKKRIEEGRRRSHAELEQAQRRREAKRLQPPDRDAIVGVSAVLRGLLEIVDAVAATRVTVLLRGESGVGKELLARAIHERSQRRDGPLVTLNCSSLTRHRPARFELADGGTLLLDEVGAIPPELQPELLQLLQETEGGVADVRVIATTNHDLEGSAAAGRLRRDLYYRLSVFPVAVPPLRERREDIVPLAEHFLGRHAAQLQRAGLELDDAQRRRLVAYDWPGNVRELRHVIERAVLLSPQPPLALELPARSDDEPRRLERLRIVAALERAGGRIGGTGGAAELLGLHPSTLRDRMRSLGIPRRP
jgi:transcriptional regulator with GAF, ATPase, and Fis domain